MEENNVRSLSPFNTELKLKGFKVYSTCNDTGGHNYSRKDFYKISVTTGLFKFHYADKTFETDETFLFFANPHIPYSCEVVSATHYGYTCLFSEAFFKPNDRSESLLQSSLFKIGGTPIFKLTAEQKISITA